MEKAAIHSRSTNPPLTLGFPFSPALVLYVMAFFAFRS